MIVFNARAEEEVVDLLGNESDHWRDVSVCVLASVPSVLVVISLVNVVCEVDLPSVSVSDCEIVEPQTLSFCRKRGASVALECEQYKKTKAGVEASPFRGDPGGGALFVLSDRCDGYCQCLGEECVQPRWLHEVRIHEEVGRKLGGRRKAVCDSAHKTGNGSQGAPRER